MISKRVSKPIPRREFLRISSSAALGIAASGLIDPMSLFAATPNLPLLSIGYASAIPTAGRQAPLAAAATAILSGDPSFLRRSARVKVAGFARGAKHVTDPGGVELDAIYPVLSYRPENYPRFMAWSFNGPAADSANGGPIVFNVPVTATDGLQFLVHRLKPNSKPTDVKKPNAPDAAEQNRVQLAVNSGGDAKLARGAYVFAFREGGDDTAPNWPRLAVANNDGFLTVPGIGLSYAVLTVDYAA
jgi:hypothetical protein